MKESGSELGESQKRGGRKQLGEVDVTRTEAGEVEMRGGKTDVKCGTKNEDWK